MRAPKRCTDARVASRQPALRPAECPTRVDIAIERPLSATLRYDCYCLGLCDACPYAPACALILPSRAGVAQAPMEETAAYFAAVAKAMGI